MKSVPVPAQVTTIEDRIAGKLTLQQVVILVSALLMDFIVFAIFPSALKINFIKLLIITLITTFFSISSLRLKEKLVIYWVVLIIKYLARPRYYVYDKNDYYLRQNPATLDPENLKVTKPNKHPLPKKMNINTEDHLRIIQLISSDFLQLKFSKRKGALNVSVTEKAK
jgi:hypothetical protein